ncbi:MAG TPA: saccharopine dehydrogenase C-terminal domain-containing protein [Thermoanaerobaculia bacterium]|nr:saccharopine dehydrogenase C-terminal domain-containing protein [Thermoanaerobaculia bacterium]
MARRHRIIIAGAGNIGEAAGLLLRELGDFEVDLFLGDLNLAIAQRAAEFIRGGSTKPGEIECFAMPADGVNPEFTSALSRAEILLDCLPGQQAPRMARLAHEHDLHYVNLTEYVKETEEIMEIARGARRGFLLQTGLAPGYVNVLGHSLFQTFCRTWGVDSIDSLKMRVGALTENARPPHYYGFTWSSIGVATEYVKPSTVVRDGERTEAPSLSGLETILLGGVAYEEALTSGGAADLPVALAGRVRTLDYKTLRYPGHYGWVKSILAQVPQGCDPARYLHDAMEKVVPFVEDDRVVIYAAVEGKDSRGILRRTEKHQTIHPIRVGARTLKAIQATTAAGLAESARFLLTEGHSGGVCLQSQIDPDHFMAGPFVAAVYHR